MARLTKSKIIKALIEKLRALAKRAYDVLLKTKVENVRKLVDVVADIIEAYAVDRISDKDMVKIIHELKKMSFTDTEA